MVPVVIILVVGVACISNVNIHANHAPPECTLPKDVHTHTTLPVMACQPQHHHQHTLEPLARACTSHINQVSNVKQFLHLELLTHLKLGHIIQLRSMG